VTRRPDPAALLTLIGRMSPEDLAAANRILITWRDGAGTGSLAVLGDLANELLILLAEERDWRSERDVIQAQGGGTLLGPDTD